MAREVCRQQGRLGEQEVEVGEASFAAGDHVITRVNDQRAARSTTASAGGSRRSTPRRRVDARRHRRPTGGSSSMPTTWGADNPTRGPRARTRLRGDDLLRPGRHGRPRLRHGRTLDGQAGALRRRLARPRETFIYATPEVDPPRGDRAGLPLSARGPRAHRRSGRARPRPDRRPRAGTPGAVWRRSPPRSYTRCRGELASEARSEERDERITDELGRRLGAGPKT